MDDGDDVEATGVHRDNKGWSSSKEANKAPEHAYAQLGRNTRCEA